MEKKNHNNLGATPLPKGKRKPGIPLFKKSNKEEVGTKQRDRTGQTDTSLKHLKQRLAEVPKKSAGSKHDKSVFDGDKPGDHS